MHTTIAVSTDRDYALSLIHIFSEVDRKVMRILRAEEKRIRRSYGSDNTSEDEDGASSAYPACPRQSKPKNA